MANERIEEMVEETEKVEDLVPCEEPEVTMESIGDHGRIPAGIVIVGGLVVAGVAAVVLKSNAKFKEFRKKRAKKLLEKEGCTVTEPETAKVNVYDSEDVEENECE